MTTVNEQIKRELALVETDARKYYNRQDAFRNKGLTDQTDSAAYVIRSGVLDIADTLEGFATRKTRGIGGKYNQLLRNVAARIDPKSGDLTYDYGAVAYLGLQSLFQSLTHKGATWNRIVHTIAARLEADHKARLFEAKEPAYYNAVMRSFDAQLIQQYQHKHRVIMKKFNDFDIAWVPWNPTEKLQVATKVLIGIIHTLPHVFFRHIVINKGKRVSMVDTLPTADEWFGEFERERGFLNPAHPPMLVQPRNWHVEDGQIQGGYYTPRLTATLPFVKTRSQEHLDFVNANDLSQHMQAINKMQATPWRIATDVLDVQQTMFKEQLGNGLPVFKPSEVPEFPEHLKQIQKEHLTEIQKDEIATWKVISKQIHLSNKMQQGKVLAYKSIADTARQYRDNDQFFFVYNADFRGRIYCATAGLSPQGEDLAKSLLQFATGVPHGETGLLWLAVHGANVYGYDKGSYDDRRHWIHSQYERFRAVIADPIANREYWGSADKPWQFLSFIFEWAKTDYGKNPDVRGHLPIGLDGSCNGIQHYSALLRDPVGARAVNLDHTEIPADIYADVASELRRLLTEDLRGDTFRIRNTWLSSHFDRKLTKRPVMTLPYGATKQSAKEYVYSWMLDNRGKFNIPDQELFSYALYLTHHLWVAIGNVVIAARAGMDWIQSATTQALKDHNEPVTWRTPIGFPVYQAYKKTTMLRVQTMLAGSTLARLTSTSRVETPIIDRRRQRSGIAPNFVHSLDSTHMVMTINGTDFTSYAMIHDDFGTHAGNTQVLWQAIRDQFVELYTMCDPLADWYAEQNPKKPLELPEKGTFDVRKVLNSLYFFG